MSHLSSTRGRRSAAVLATALTTGSLVVAGLGFTTAPATAHPAGDRAVNAAASWLKGELEGGFLVGDFGPNYGPSVDVGLSLAEVGDMAGAGLVDTALRPEIENYISGEAFGDAGSTYAGAAAKAATFATVVGADPASYGGADLVSRLEGTVSTTAPTTGRIGDVSMYGDFANAIGQSFAARALTTVGSPRAGDATAFLLDQQCTEGFFRFDLTEDKNAPEQGCVSGAADSAPDMDTTALAVINLLDTPGISADGTAAASAAAAWLKSQQGADGSFANTDNGTNANTTGLVARALAAAGDTAAATKAAAWLRAVQIADLAPCATQLAAENGAIAPKPEILASTRTAGAIPAGQRISYAFATAQALPALANVPAGTGPLTVSAPATAVEKSTVTVTVAGLGAGEAGCVSFGSVAKPVTGNGGNVTVTFDLPAGAATHTFKLATLAGTLTATTNATLTPVPPTPEVGTLNASKVEKVKRNKFKLSVTCDDTDACEGKIVVRTTRKVSIGDAKARKILIAKKSYSVEPGERERVVLKVRMPASPALDSGRIRVKAVQTAPGAERAVTKFWLRKK